MKRYIKQIQDAKGGIAMSVKKKIKKSVKRTVKAGKKAAWIAAFTTVAMVACPIVMAHANDDD